MEQAKLTTTTITHLRNPSCNLLAYAFLVNITVILLNSVFSSDIRWARILWKRLKTSSMISSPKWLTSIGSATDLMHCARLYPLSLTDSDLSRGFQFTPNTSRRSMANDPSLRTSNFSSDGDGVYCGMLKLSNSSSFIIPCTNYSKRIHIHACACTEFKAQHQVLTCRDISLRAIAISSQIR